MGTIFLQCRMAAIAAIIIVTSHAATLGVVAAAETQPAPSCDAMVTGPDAPTVGKATRDDGATNVSLGQIVTITGVHLDRLFDKACANRDVVLFLNDWPLTDVKPRPPVDPAGGKLNFKLINKHYDDSSKDPWLPILGSPSFTPVPVKVSLGFANGFAMRATQGELPALELTVLPPWWVLLWGAIFIAMVAIFWYMVRHTTVLRDPGPNGAQGTYSLSRSQGALWFFVILAAYLFIGIVTGDFSNSINSTAVILLGIGAGTVLGSAAIDAQKKADGTAAAPAASAGYLNDILSDANGISFHRFQMASWTAVLSVIFIMEVYRTLAMPTFNTTLMGLLGLSAGTYLGLKIPEATKPG